MSKLRSGSILASLTADQRDQLYARDVCFAKPPAPENSLTPLPSVEISASATSAQSAVPKTPAAPPQSILTHSDTLKHDNSGLGTERIRPIQKVQNDNDTL